MLFRWMFVTILTLALASCAAMKEANIKNIFNVAYAQDAEQIAPDTYQVSFQFIVFAGQNVVQERESLRTGMLGALARKGKEMGFVGMRTQTCKGSRGFAGGTPFIRGECSALMLREAGLEGDIVIEEALEKAAARQAQLEKL